MPFETIVQSDNVFTIALKNSSDGTELQKIPAGKYDKSESKFYPYFKFLRKSSTGQYMNVNVFSQFYPQSQSYKVKVKVYSIYREETDYGTIKLLYYSKRENTWKQNENKKSLYFNYDYVNQQIERLNKDDEEGLTHVNAKLKQQEFVIKNLVNDNVPFPLLSGQEFYEENYKYYDYLYDEVIVQIQKNDSPNYQIIKYDINYRASNKPIVGAIQQGKWIAKNNDNYMLLSGTYSFEGQGTNTNYKHILIIDYDNNSYNQTEIKKLSFGNSETAKGQLDSRSSIGVKNKLNKDRISSEQQINLNISEISSVIIF